MFKELPSELQQKVKSYLQRDQFLKAKELVDNYQVKPGNFKYGNSIV